ncbi:MAG TPA: DUF423 domain-containing protein [Opitutaceae bacterium]|nr:DUF423 domain-containing protein [Opitutaceae bacterium]
MLSPTETSRFALLAAGIFGLTAVALGAFGAHGLEPMLTERGMMRSWETAARYHLIHSLALLAAAAWLQTGAPGAGRRILWATRWWCVGIVLFSGALYGYALGGPRWLGRVAPVGGIALMLGWLFVAFAARAKEPPRP